MTLHLFVAISLAQLSCLLSIRCSISNLPWDFHDSRCGSQSEVCAWELSEKTIRLAQTYHDRAPTIESQDLWDQLKRGYPTGKSLGHLIAVSRLINLH